MNYPRLQKLGVVICHDPITHVKTAELRNKLSELQFRTVMEGLVGQTCVLVDEVGEPYPWDVEAILSGKPGLWD